MKLNCFPSRAVAVVCSALRCAGSTEGYSLNLILRIYSEYVKNSSSCESGNVVIKHGCTGAGADFFKKDA